MLFQRIAACSLCYPAGTIDFVVPKGSGYIAHPAVADNCIQLGPVSGLPAPGEAAEPQVTRYAHGHYIASMKHMR